MRDRQCSVYAHLSIVHSFRRSFLSFFSPVSLSLSPPFPSLDPCSSWGRPDSSIKPINPRQPMAARCSHWDPSIDHSVSLCSLSLSFHGRSPFFLASTGSLLFEYQLRPPNLFNERLINVKAHRQKGYCRRRPDFPLSLSNARSSQEASAARSASRYAYEEETAESWPRRWNNSDRVRGGSERSSPLSFR